jgi:Ca2+-transporting ATPase
LTHRQSHQGVHAERVSAEVAKYLNHPWATKTDVILDQLQTDDDQGLTTDQVAARKREFGLNKLRKHKARSSFLILVDQFASIIIALLVAAAVFAFWLGEFIDGWAIIIVILINALIGFVTELRAVRSMEALYKLGKTRTRVRRNGKTNEIDAEELVPGDIVIIEAGDIITADMRIISGSKLQANEAALTGESMPVEKNPDSLAEDTVLAERSCMLYKGTAIALGSGSAVVVSTGMETELGHISSLVEEIEDEQTPLEKRLDKLGYRLIGITLLIAAFIIGTGIIGGKDMYLMVETGIALAVAAIPEGLPIVATIALAKGIQIMADKNALINRLSSVETLGATNIICTDKTGTLTENRMEVSQIFLAGRDSGITFSGTSKEPLGNTGSTLKVSDDANLRLALEVASLCNNASLDGSKSSGDPLEVALLESARNKGFDLAELLNNHTEVREEAFNPEEKMMATWHTNQEGAIRVSVKGAPEAVLQVCSSITKEGKQHTLDEHERNKWQTLNHDLGEKGLRIIALATKNVDSIDGNPYEDLSLLGLVALSDPPRIDVKDSIRQCHDAGIRVVMVTGDQEPTARYIAESVGLNRGRTVIHGKTLSRYTDKDGSLSEVQNLLDVSIFARVSPQQKLDLINLFQQSGNIVAMTGDGVNDAPALKEADIGIAMGKRGTQVAREAADMILTDDAFSTIVSAIEQGRIIFSNIRRFIYYLMSCNVSEVMIVGIAAVLNTPLPILPLQILFLNLVTDVFPALALGVGEGNKQVMKNAPRPPRQPILGRSEWLGIAFFGAVITVSVLGAFYIALHYLGVSVTEAVTISFLTLALAQLWHVFNMRDDGANYFDNTITRNKYVWAALVICVILLLLALYVPVIAQVLNVVPPGTEGWIIAVSMSLIPVLVGLLRQ